MSIFNLFLKVSKEFLQLQKRGKKKKEVTLNAAWRKYSCPYWIKLNRGHWWKANPWRWMVYKQQDSLKRNWRHGCRNLCKPGMKSKNECGVWMTRNITPLNEKNKYNWILGRNFTHSSVSGIKYQWWVCTPLLSKSCCLNTEKRLTDFHLSSKFFSITA
jgi:hypothetical protein